MKTVSLKDVAAKANVSLTTASMVFRGTAEKYGISKRTIIEVERIGKELHYSKNIYAASLKNQRSNMIGLFSTASIAQIRQIRQNIMSAYLRAKEYNVILEDFYWSEDPGKVLTEIASFMPEGLIICDLEERKVDAALEFLSDKGIPMVLVDAHGKEKYDNIWIDREMVGYLAAKHLFQQGCREVYYTLHKDVRENYRSLSAAHRFEGFSRARMEILNDAEAERCLLADPEKRVGGDQNYYDWGYNIGKDFVRQTRDFPVGIITLNDHTAVGLLKALLEEGIKIPEEVAIVGTENLPETAYCHIPLSTVSFPIEVIALKACEILLKKISVQDDDRVHIKLTPELVVRASSLRQS